MFVLDDGVLDLTVVPLGEDKHFLGVSSGLHLKSFKSCLPTRDLGG